MVCWDEGRDLANRGQINPISSAERCVQELRFTEFSKAGLISYEPPFWSNYLCHSQGTFANLRPGLLDVWQPSVAYTCLPTCWPLTCEIIWVHGPFQALPKRSAQSSKWPRIKIIVIRAHIRY